MKFIYIVLLILSLGVVNIYSKSVNLNEINSIIPENKKYIPHNKRSLNGSSSCRPLNFTKNLLKLHYQSISILKQDTITAFASCYYEISKGIIICNEITARYVYIFYLPVSSINNINYGRKKENQDIRCSVDNYGIKDWTFYYQFSNTTQASHYIYTNTNKKDEYEKYHFELTFDNDCVYYLPVEKVQFKKVSSPSICESQFSKEKQEL